MTAVLDEPGHSPPAEAKPRHLLVWQAAVVAAALGARLTVLFRHGLPRGSFGYDSAVYFAASDALLHGRVPYRDFVLLHPPGLMLALTPFAALTRVMSDPTAFATAAVCFAVLGAVNAVLVMRVCRQLGLAPRAAVAAGAFYAVWFGAVRAEYLARLEPLGNFLLLTAILFLLKAQKHGRLRHEALAGVALGALVSTKIWWAIPAIALIGWHVWRRRSPSGCLVLIGGVELAAILIDLPFFVSTPRAMWASVVSDQVGRRADSRIPFPRLADLGSLTAVDTTPSSAARLTAGLLTVIVAGLVVRAAWRLPVVRPFVALLVAQGAVVLVSPSWFGFYTDFLAVSASITLGAAAASRQLRARVLSAIVVTVSAGLTAAALVLGTSSVRPTPGVEALTHATSTVPCIMSDSPMGQIELDALTRGLESGCPNWVDVTGRTYGPDRGPVPRSHNARWQRDLSAYLRAGQAVVIVRAHGTGLNAETWAAVRRDGTLACSGDLVVYRVVTANGSGSSRSRTEC